MRYLFPLLLAGILTGCASNKAMRECDRAMDICNPTMDLVRDITDYSVKLQDKKLSCDEYSFLVKGRLRNWAIMVKP